MHYNEVYFSQQSEFGDSPDSSTQIAGGYKVSLKTDYKSQR